MRANWEILYGHNAFILPIIYNCSNQFHGNLENKTKQNEKQEYVIDWTLNRCARYQSLFGLLMNGVFSC